MSGHKCVMWYDLVVHIRMSVHVVCHDMPYGGELLIFMSHDTSCDSLGEIWSVRSQVVMPYHLVVN